MAGTADQFMFVYQRLTGDGVVKLRLLTLAGTSGVEAGVTIRESLSATARHASLLMGSSGTVVRSRAAVGGQTTSVAVARGTWLRLERVGQTITASISSDGTQWTAVRALTVTLPSTAYVGIAVTSRASSALATATVSNMAVTATTPTMPPGWSSADVGSAPSAGTASYSNGVFTASSSGAGLAGAADAFRFIHARVRGDAKLSVRVAASQGKVGRQAGIVLRTTLDRGAAETALIADDAGLLLVRRAGAGQTALKNRLTTLVAPVYLKLDRAGSLITVAYSSNGTTWNTAAAVAVSFGSEIYAGLAVAAGPNGGASAAAFDRLSLVSVAANAPPAVSLTAPLGGAVVLQGQPVALAATASDPDDVVARVDFNVNGVKVASDTAAPYAASWTPGAPGVYTVTAAAADSDGAVTTSLPALVTVSADVLPLPDSGSQLPAGPWRLVFDASLDHATISGYVLQIYDSITRRLIVTKNIGKPARASNGTCTVDVDLLVTALPAGLFDAVVVAVDPSGQTPSFPYTFNR